MIRQLVLASLLFQQPAVPTASMGVVSGTIVYADGTPAANMFLRFTPVVQRPGNLIATSDATGAFNRSLDPGQYVIRITTPFAVFYPGVLTEAEARPVVVSA